MSKVPSKDDGLCHVGDLPEEEYIVWIEKVVYNPGSYEHVLFYNFILNCFVEADGFLWIFDGSVLDS